MTPEERHRRGRIYELFQQSYQLDPQARETFLSQACAGDPALRFEVDQRLVTRDQRNRTTLRRLRLEDDYTLGRELGRGAAGVVYQAHQKSLDRSVAIKLLLAGGHASREELQRFRLEAEAAGSLQHPGIVPVYEIGQDDSCHWIAMQLLEGPSLKELIEQDRIAPRRAAELTEAVADAVAHAHARGVIHRDLKPGNILLDHEQQPVITDFGLARRLDSEASMTEAGRVLGTPGYMSPEQAAGDRSRVTVASDVYALGAVLFALLTGRPPIESSGLAELYQRILEEEPPSPRKFNSRIPRDLETICLKCLRKEPADRYRTAQQVADELARFRRGEPIEARPLGLTARGWRWCRRRPWIASLSAAVVASLVIGTAVSMHFAFDAREQARRAIDNAALFAEARDAASERAREAEAAALEARRQAYANQMTAAQTAMETRDTDRAWRLLNALRPTPGQTDLRGFEWYALAGMLESELTVFHGHRGRIACLQAAPHRPLFATGGFDTDIRLWELQTGRSVATLSGHREVVIAIAFSPDGQLLASASGDGTVRLWNIADPVHTEHLRMLRRGGTPVSSVAFSSDGRLLAAGSTADVWIWNLEDSGQTTVLKGHTDVVRCVTFTPDDFRLLSSSSDRTIRLWNVATGELEQTLTGHKWVVHSLDFSPDGRYLASGSWDRTVRLWQTSDWQHVRTFLGHEGIIRSVRFTADGRRLVSGGEDRIIRMWNVDDATDAGQMAGHTGMIWELDISPQDGTLISIGEAPRIADDESAHGSGGTVRLWDAASATERQVQLKWSQRARRAWRIPSWLWEVAVCQESGEVLVALDDATVTAWSLETGRQTGIFRGHERRLKSLDLSQETLATGSEDGTLRIWDVPSRSLTRTIDNGGMAVETIALSPAARLVAMNAPHGECAVYDVSTGARVQTLACSGESVSALAWSPDARQLAVGDSDGTIEIRAMPSGRRVRTMQQHEGRIHDLEWSPDGRLLATAGSDLVACLWDSATGELLHTLRGHLNQVFSVAFSPNGTRLATGSTDKTTRVWDVQTGHELLTLRGHADEVTSVAFADGGQTLIAGVKGWDGRLFGQVVVWQSAGDESLLDVSRRHAAAEDASVEDCLAYALCCREVASHRRTVGERRKLLRTGLQVLEQLQADSRLPSQRAAWIAAFREALEQSPAADH